MFINESITRYMEETAEKRRRAKELEELIRPQWGKPCKTPLKDIEAAARAAEIITEFTELKRKQEQFEHEVKQFNKLLPSGIEHRHISVFSNYL